MLTDDPVKTAIAQTKTSKKVHLPKYEQYSLFYKNKQEKNQLPLLNKNSIIWYVYTPIPMANQEIWVQCRLCKTGYMKNAFFYVCHSCDTEEEP